MSKSEHSNQPKKLISSKDLISLKSEMNTLSKQIEECVKKLEHLTSLLEKSFIETKVEKLGDISGTKGPSMSINQIGETLKQTLREVQAHTVDIPNDAEGVQPSTIDTQARVSEVSKKSDIIVEKFEVEIKGGISLEEGVSLVEPDYNKLTSEGFSTVRLSLKPKPVFEIIEEKTDQQPTTEPEQPTTKKEKQRERKKRKLS